MTEHRQNFDLELRKLEGKKVTKALREAGLEVESVYDLVNTRESYSDVIPILLNFLERGLEDDVIYEGVVRALTVIEAKKTAGKAMISAFKRTAKEKEFLRWAMGNAIGFYADESMLDDIEDIVRDESNGTARQQVVSGLRNITNARAKEILISVLDDDEVAAHALEALRNKNPVEAKERIELLVKHQKPLIRKEAKKLLKKLQL